MPRYWVRNRSTGVMPAGSPKVAPVAFEPHPGPVGGGQNQGRFRQVDVPVRALADFRQPGADVRGQPQDAPFFTRTWLMILRT